MNIVIVGTGYVGLVTGACLASKGNSVICVDRDSEKLAKLARGIMPIYEPGLDTVARDAVNMGTLRFSANLARALEQSPNGTTKHQIVIFIAVGTPQGEDGSADLKYVMAVASEIGQELRQPAIVVNKSTVPVGTADMVRGEIAWQLFRRKLFLEFEVASNPEFLKEGDALADFFNPDRIVIGTDNVIAKEQLTDLYRPFVKSPEKILTVGVKEAELIKYASNAMLATRISFMNEVANICNRFGIDVDQVRSGVGSDSRIGPAFLRAGAGYGGSCFPKDVQALIRIAQSVGVDPFVLNGVEERNRAQKHFLFHAISRHWDGRLHGLKVAVWGLAFKPETDDMREAPSTYLIRALTAAGAKVSAHDPVATDTATQALSDLLKDGSLEICRTSLDATRGADALAIVTEWPEYIGADFSAVHASLKTPILFDGRNCLSVTALKAAGFEYQGVGRS